MCRPGLCHCADQGFVRQGLARCHPEGHDKHQNILPPADRDKPRQAAAASCRCDNEAMFFEDPPSSLHSSRLGFVTPGCVLDGADENGLDRIKKRGKRDPCDIRPVLLFTLWHGPEGDVN